MRTGELIGIMAKDNGISLHQLAMDAGIPYNTLYAIVRRKSERIDIDTLSKLANSFGVTVNYFSFRKEIEKSSSFGATPLPDALPLAQHRPLKGRVDKPVGIYAIRCNETGRIYIGLSTDIDGRLRNHLANLRTGKHPASLLQEYFDRYGEESLSLFVLEEGLTIEEARRKEQEYIAEYGTRNPANGYNTVHPNIRKNLDLIYAKPPKNAEILKNK